MRIGAWRVAISHVLFNLLNTLLALLIWPLLTWACIASAPDNLLRQAANLHTFVMIAALLLFAFILDRTRLGGYTYAIGSNETAGRFSGMPIDRAKFWIYTFSGLMAGVAATIFVSRVSTTRSDMGTGIEMDVISAVVLGGTSIFGGRGTMTGTILGLLLIQTLKNGLTLAGIKGDGTIIVIGAILILTILGSNLFDRLRQN